MRHGHRIDSRDQAVPSVDAEAGSVALSLPWPVLAGPGVGGAEPLEDLLFVASKPWNFSVSFRRSTSFAPFT
jgi:hypothetical protein